MKKLIFFGTSSAVATKGREHTHLAVVGKQSVILIDCSGNPVRKLNEQGLDFQHLSDLIVTHFHPDHVSGLPLLLMDMWILGRKKALTIHGTNHTIYRAKQMMDLYDWEDWQDLYPVNFHQIPLENRSLVLENDEFNVASNPVSHTIPSFGLRVENKKNGFTVTYSGDTDPCPQVVNLAKGSNVLIHEATGGYPGHSTPAEAGEIAAKAGVQSLYLVHYPLNLKNPAQMIKEARDNFSGEIIIAKEDMEIELGN